MTERPLTIRQRHALVMLPGTYRWTLSSMPSLARRGLVERTSTVEHGRRVLGWRLTEAGEAKAAEIRAELRRG